MRLSCVFNAFFMQLTTELSEYLVQRAGLGGESRFKMMNFALNNVEVCI